MLKPPPGEAGLDDGFGVGAPPPGEEVVGVCLFFVFDPLIISSTALANLSTMNEKVSIIPTGIVGIWDAGCNKSLSERAFTAAPPAAIPPSPNPSIPNFPPLILAGLAPGGRVFFNPPPGTFTSRLIPEELPGLAEGKLDN